MTMIFLIIGCAAGLGLALVKIARLEKKLANGLFIEREGDRVVFKDDKGNRIGERIIIQTEK